MGRGFGWMGRRDGLGREAEVVRRVVVVVVGGLGLGRKRRE